MEVTPLMNMDDGREPEGPKDISKTLPLPDEASLCKGSQWRALPVARNLCQDPLGGMAASHCQYSCPKAPTIHHLFQQATSPSLKGQSSFSGRG